MNDSTYQHIKCGAFFLVRASLLLSMIFLSSGTCWAGTSFQRTSGDLIIEIELDRFPPIIGENPIAVEIRDPSGTVVTDAKVMVNYYMPPMPRMAPMNYRVDAPLRRGKYRAQMKFIMEGPWVIAVKITRPGKTSTVKVNVNVP